MTKPGFYRVNVKTTIEGKEYRNTCAAAFSPEKIQANAECLPTSFENQAYQLLFLLIVQSSVEIFQ